MIKLVITFIVGFLVAVALLMFNTKIHIGTNTKVLTSIERLPDVFFDNYTLDLTPNSEGCYPINQI